MIRERRELLTKGNTVNRPSSPLLSRFSLRSLSIAAFCLAAACDKAPDPAAGKIAPATAPAAATQAAVTAASVGAAADPHAGMAAGNPHGAVMPGMAGGAAGVTLTGKVAETMNSGGYTYLRLTTAQGDVWAAVPETQATEIGRAHV